MTEIDRKTENANNRENSTSDPLMELTKLFNLNTASLNNNLDSGAKPAQDSSNQHSPSNLNNVNESQTEGDTFDLSFLDDELENSLEETFHEQTHQSVDSVSTLYDKLKPPFSDQKNEPSFTTRLNPGHQNDLQREAETTNSDQNIGELNFSASSDEIFSDNVPTTKLAETEYTEETVFTAKNEAPYAEEQYSSIPTSHFEDYTSQDNGDRWQETSLQNLADYQDSDKLDTDHFENQSGVEKNFDFIENDDNFHQASEVQSENHLMHKINDDDTSTYSKDFGEVADNINYDASADASNSADFQVSSKNLEEDLATPIFPQAINSAQVIDTGFNQSVPLHFNNHIYYDQDEPKNSVDAQQNASAYQQGKPLNEVSQLGFSQNTAVNEQIEEGPCNTAQYQEPQYLDRAPDNQPFENIDGTEFNTYTELAGNNVQNGSDTPWFEEDDTQTQTKFPDSNNNANWQQVHDFDQSRANPESFDTARLHYENNNELNQALDEFQTSNLMQPDDAELEKHSAIQAPDVNTYKFEDERVKPIENFELPPVSYEEKPKNDNFDSLEYEFDDVFNVGALAENVESKNEQNAFFDDAQQMTQISQDQTDSYQENQGFDGATTNIHYDPNAQWGWNGTTGLGLEGVNPIAKQKTRKTFYLWGLLVLIIVFIGGGYYYSKTSRIGATPAIIHADSSPFKVAAPAKENDNHENLDVDAYESASGHSEKNTQQVLVDKSEAPEDVAALNEKPPVATEDTVKQANIEDAISSASNQVVPTRVVPSVVVNLDGSIVLSKPKASPETSTKTTNNTTTQEASIDQIVAETKNTPDIDKLLHEQTNTGKSGSSSAIQRTKTDKVNELAQANASNTKPQQVAVETAQTPVVKIQTPTSTKVQEAAKLPITSTAGGYYVQLASNPTQALAQTSLAKAKSNFGAVIGNLPIGIQTATIPNRGTYYRVRVQLGSRSEAVALCENLKQHGASCFVGR